MQYSCIRYERLDNVARISHDRPAARNAQNVQLLDELHDAVGKARDDTAVKVVVIAGIGDHFSAGHDLKEASEWNRTVEERWEFENHHYLEYCLEIRDLEKPTIAQVQGACIAAGFMVANMCDLLVASDDAFFGDPVVHSISAAAVEVLIHPWVLGLRKAKEMLFTGQRISAQDALAWGMANRVVPRAQLEEATLELANRIAAAPSFATRMIKRSLNRTQDMQGFRSALSAHFDLHQLTHATEEYRLLRQQGIAGAIKTGKDAGQSGGGSKQD